MSESDLTTLGQLPKDISTGPRAYQQSAIAQPDAARHPADEVPHLGPT